MISAGLLHPDREGIAFWLPGLYAMNDGDGMSYVFILRQLYVLFQLDAWGLKNPADVTLLLVAHERTNVGTSMQILVYGAKH